MSRFLLSNKRAFPAQDIPHRQMSRARNRDALVVTRSRPTTEHSNRVAEQDGQVADQEGAPIWNFLVPKSTPAALVAGRPFFSVTAWTSCDPVLALHFKGKISGTSDEVAMWVFFCRITT